MAGGRDLVIAESAHGLTRAQHATPEASSELTRPEAGRRRLRISKNEQSEDLYLLEFENKNGLSDLRRRWNCASMLTRLSTSGRAGR
jgi:hypothetical protein